MSLEDEFSTTSHPSYGVMRFNKCHVHPRALFGSSIKHSDLVTLEIDYAELSRGFNGDWIHPRNHILRASMSFSQFAEAITSFGDGVGIPITLEMTEYLGRIEPLEFHGKIEQFENEFKETLDKNSETTKNAKTEIAQILEKKSIGKGDREKILRLLDQIISQTTSNTAFVYDQFNKQMNKTVSEAKSEIEAYVQNKMDSIAAKAIANNLSLEPDDFTIQIDEK